MTDLLDANVLIALAIDDHVHHDAAERWLASSDDGFATCPITQGALMRALLRNDTPANRATMVLGRFTEDARHQFWPDELGYGDVPMYGVRGHRQVTDAYLAALVRAHGGRLVTFDRGLAALHPDVTVLVPTTPRLPEQRASE